MGVISTAIIVAGAIKTAAVATATAIGGGIMAGAGAMATKVGLAGIGGTLSGMGAGSMAAGGFAGAMAGAASAATIGGVTGGLIGGGMSALQGGDFADGFKSGAMSGAITMGAGSFGGAIGQASGFGKIGSALVGTGSGGLIGFGLGKAAGMETQEAAMTGLSAGALGGMNAYANVSQQIQYDNWLSELKDMNPGQDLGSMGTYVGSRPDSISVIDTARTGMGKLVLGLGGGLKAVTGIDAVSGSELTQQFTEQGPASGASISQGGSKGPSAIGDPDSPGAGWLRGGGELFGGIDTLSSTVPEARRRTPFGISDEMLMKDGALV